MREILDSKFIEGTKSTFNLELVKEYNQRAYVEIRQTVIRNDEVASLLINPALLPEFIRALQMLHSNLPNHAATKGRYMSEEDKVKLEKRYLKGIELSDLVLQFRQPEEHLRTILINRGITVLKNQKPPKKKYFWRRRKKAKPKKPWWQE